MPGLPRVVPPPQLCDARDLTPYIPAQKEHRGVFLDDLLRAPNGEAFVRAVSRNILESWKELVARGALPTHPGTTALVRARRGPTALVRTQPGC